MHSNAQKCTFFKKSVRKLFYDFALDFIIWNKDKEKLSIFNILKLIKAMALAASKRNAGVPAARQTLNDEELVSI